MPHAIPPTILSEDLIERRVERHMDHLDRLYLAGEITRKNYDLAVRDLHQWAEAQYQAHGRRTADRIDGYDRDDLGESPDY